MKTRHHPPELTPAVPAPCTDGRILSVRGSVVDVWFEQDLPAIYSVLYAAIGKSPYD